MHKQFVFTMVVGVLALAAVTTSWVAAEDEKSNQQKEAARVVDGKQELLDARDTLKQIMSIPEDGIPQAMLDDAAAIAIIPGVINVAFVAGGRHGDGVMVVRGADGSWSPPLFIDLTGASVGFQAGVQSTDVVLVFKNGDAARKVLNGEFTLGADASIAAGPVGRDVSAGTGLTLDQEVYSYSRSRGVFAGVALDGSKIYVNKDANAEYYGKAYAEANVLVAGKGLKVPAEATAFVTELSQYTTKKKS